MVFNDRDYTQDAVIKQAALIELHSKDGSALDAGCTCIEGKHLHIIEGLAEEGKGFAVSEKEKEFYDRLGNLTRSLRKNMEGDNFDMQEVLHEAGLNPYPRKYEPHGLTECEQSHPNVVHKLRACIKKVEKREGCSPPYTDCPVNPAAVCRTSIRCPP
ncbi:hypothetical protein MUP01_11965 [Candidatus Bathyarchaeota archaeon]|nr:hypothetical protein [Candidatus Bathyarchaeota archaeon]